MMRRYEQGSSHRLKAVGFRPNYAEGIFMKERSGMTFGFAPDYQTKKKANSLLTWKHRTISIPDTGWSQGVSIMQEE